MKVTVVVDNSVPPSARLPFLAEHLGPAGPLQRSASLDALEALAPELIAANHCTGFAMMAALQHRFGERFIPAMVGTVIHL